MSEQDINEEAKLPLEILTHLFSFLSLSDRKNVRLTCSRWYDACNVARFLQKEKLVIRTNMVHCNVVTDTLMKCQYKYMNLHFQGLNFYNDSRKYWKQFGARIHSLFFSYCFVGEEVVEEILLSCKNLKYLNLDRCHDLHYTLERVLSGSDLSRFSISSLISLEFNFIKLHDDIFRKIWEIFPNIKELGVDSIVINCYKRIDGRYYGKDIPENPSFFNSQYIFTFSCLFHHLNLNASVIEKLVFNKIADRGLTDDCLEEIGSLPNLRLKELNLAYHSLLSEQAFIDFFSKQTHLVKINISKCMNFTLQCILHVLTNCPNLTHLIIELDSYREFTFNQVLFNAIQKSRLVMFESIYAGSINCSPIQVDSGVVNTSLQCWNSSVPLLNSFCPSLVEAFCNLTTLKLISPERSEGLMDDALQSIFRKLINLKKFTLCTSSKMSDYGFTGKVDGSDGERCHGYSIKRLSKLETLSIILSVKCGITDLTFSEFVFPCLQKLCLTIENKISEAAILLMAPRIPQLKNLFIASPGISHSPVFKCMETWSNLTTLNVIDPNVIRTGVKKPAVGYQDLMQCNKSLRYCKVYEQVFCYNIFNNHWVEYVREGHGKYVEVAGNN